ncbi:sickle tail protein homolog isoform X2 [Nerophis ophidion]|uniref:sickle tail protein homolog isoform X2 n=1 Tax=Nerophis ophidion TaxID=159077 RepID=UPI002ADFBFCE|nr:sickle tail protein homolog isoform X2 [Nerophis ophidion]
MSKASRLARPPSARAVSKLPSPRKECPGTAALAGQARLLSVGEKLMRAGTDNVLTKQKSPSAAGPQDKARSDARGPGEAVPAVESNPCKSRTSLPKAPRQEQGSVQKHTKSNLRVTSPEDTEHAPRRPAPPNGTQAPKGGRSVPRRHTLGGARGSREVLAMQPPDMDKKREAFLEHLKHKYPHHASAIMGHQERLREQSLQGMLSSLHSELDVQRYLMKVQSHRTSRSPKHSHSPQPGVGDQVDHLSLTSLDSLEAMSEVEVPVGFTRGTRIRASLPVVRSTNQTKDRSLGVLYLQYGDETKQIRMPNEITSIDTIRALFVSAFPQMLTMKMLESPSVAVYVKDDMRNMYYELSDVRNITDHSCLKVYHKDPAQAFRPANGDTRMHAEMANPPRQPPMGPPAHHPLQAGLPPSPHSMQPSRIPFSPRQASLPGNGTTPRERLSTANPPTRSISPCPSAILERRDVKPDGDMSGKTHSLSRGNEGLYADPFLLQEGRMSMAVAHGPHPSPGHDCPDHGMPGFHRASIRSTGSYSGPSPTDSIDHPSLYRQKSRNSQLPTLGSKTPPPSPHRMGDVRIIDIHGGVPMERSSPVRQSFKKDDVTGAKLRNNTGSSDPQGHLQGSILPASDNQARERMKAMEQQIASLTGLVQHALLKGPASEKTSKTSSPSHSAHSSGDSPVPPAKCGPSNVVCPDKTQVPFKANLLQFRKNVSDLRMQLHQMRQLQLQNQEVLRVQLKRAEQEIGMKLAETMRRLDDPVQKQRVSVEEDRQKYLSLEERVLVQLGDLEQYVVSLQKDSSGTHRAVTLKDVEEGAVTLRKVGESLAGLKGEFPTLQTRMRSVLRVEVEAVKFLKEEPHKLDSMLKRVKSLTDTLSSLRRSATDGLQKAADTNIPGDNSPSVVKAPVADPHPASVQPRSTAPPLESQSSTAKSEVNPASPVVLHHVESSLTHSQPSASLSAAQLSFALTPSLTHSNAPNLSKTQGRESPKASAAEPPSPAHHKTPCGSPVNQINRTIGQDLVIEELQTNQDKRRNRAVSIEAAEKEWEEKRQNMGQYDEKEFEKILQEAEANMTKGLPSPDGTSNPGVLPSNTQSPLQSPTEPQRETLSDKASKKVPEKLPKPMLEKPAKPVLDRASKTSPKPASPDSSHKLASEKATKSPPPPPPRKTFTSSGSGMTTTRCGEVVYTNRKDPAPAQEGEDDDVFLVAQIKPAKAAPPEAKNPAAPPLVVASSARDEEDEGDKIMAELQVFQKCTVQEVGVQNVVEPTTRIEAQIRELRTGPPLPVKEKKNSESNRDGKDPDTDENGNTTVRQSQGVIYYVTGKIPSHSGTEETHEHGEPAQSPTQVSNVTVNDNSSGQPLSQPSKSPPPKSPPPISPKPVGLNGFKLPRKPMKRSESLKTSAEMEKGKNLNRINAEKKSLFIQQSVSSTKSLNPETAVSTARVVTKRPAPLPPLRRSSNEDIDPPKQILEVGNEEASLSPDAGEEAPPPPDNIAFMITNTKVQALSCGEYQELVNAKKGGVRTVTVGDATSRGSASEDSAVSLDNGFSKKPVIIIFDEPMDIRSAYKRLSTIFECEEELDRMLAAERIDEESEESDTDGSSGLQVKDKGSAVDSKKVRSSQGDQTSLSSSSSSLVSESGDGKQDGKKKFKFKFPKKQLAALTQAIRSGTKSGKKTLQVVVYEDEEESDGTVKQHKEAKRFEISRSKFLADTVKAPSPTPLKRQNSDSICRTNEIRKSTYKTLDSLEQTIKQLENTINEMGPCSPEEPVCAEVTKEEKVSLGVGLKRSASLPTSRGSALKLAGKSSFQKKTKPVLLPRPVVIPSTASTAIPTPSAPITLQQNTSVASPTSRMPVPSTAKSRQSPATTDKAAKQQKLQDAQRQFRQANGSTKRVGGDHKTTSPTVSKIPAFYPSTTKNTSDACNPTNAPPSSKSSLPSPHGARPAAPSSHIPSLSNGCLKPPSQHAGKALAFSAQAQNGRVHSSSSFSSSSSSSTPSPLSPTPVGPGGKSIRTIHTPSFTSYRAHNGNGGKSCIPTTSTAKDAI